MVVKSAIGMSALDALAWVRQHNASVRWHSKGDVEIRFWTGLKPQRRRRKDFVSAVIAAAEATAAP